MIKTPDQDCAIVAKSQKHACYPAYLNLQLLHPPGVCSYVLYSSSLYQVQTGRICRPVGHHDASLPRFVDVLYRLYHLSIHGFIPTSTYPYPLLSSRTPIPTDKISSSPSYPQPQAPPCTSTTDSSLFQQAPRLSFHLPTHLLLLPLRPCIRVHSSFRSPSK